MDYNYEYDKHITARGTLRKQQGKDRIGNTRASKGGIDGKLITVQVRMRHEDYIRRIIRYCKMNDIKSSNNSDIRQSDIIRAALDYVIDNNIILF